MTPCIWYISGLNNPWEKAVIASMLTALRASGYPLSVYVDGGISHMHAEGLVSWSALPFFDRLNVIMFKGKLWHLWGKAPFWWGLIRLRARTVHTSLDAVPRWRGYPTRIFVSQINAGEGLINPIFDIKGDWAGEEAEDGVSSILLADFKPENSLKAVLEESSFNVLKLSKGTIPFSELKSIRLLVSDDKPLSLLLAAYLTLRGIPIVARSSPAFSALLGKEGYVAVEKDERVLWQEAIDKASSETGHAISASARHFLKTSFSSGASADSLADLYRFIMEGKV